MTSRNVGARDTFLAAEPAPEKTVGGHPDETDEWHDKTSRHAILVGDVTHQLGHDGAAHDGHDDE